MLVSQVPRVWVHVSETIPPCPTPNWVTEKSGPLEVGVENGWGRGAGRIKLLER